VWGQGVEAVNIIIIVIMIASVLLLTLQGSVVLGEWINNICFDCVSLQQQGISVTERGMATNQVAWAVPALLPRQLPCVLSPAAAQLAGPGQTKGFEVSIYHTF
jgi:hypothetical protein